MAALRANPENPARSRAYSRLLRWKAGLHPHRPDIFALYARPCTLVCGYPCTQNADAINRKFKKRCDLSLDAKLTPRTRRPAGTPSCSSPPGGSPDTPAAPAPRYNARSGLQRRLYQWLMRLMSCVWRWRPRLYPRKWRKQFFRRPPRAPCGFFCRPACGPACGYWVKVLLVRTCSLR